MAKYVMDEIGRILGQLGVTEPPTDLLDDPVGQRLVEAAKAVAYTKDTLQQLADSIGKDMERVTEQLGKAVPALNSLGELQMTSLRFDTSCAALAAQTAAVRALAGAYTETRGQSAAAGA
jgi:hypothetical protein